MRLWGSNFGGLERFGMRFWGRNIFRGIERFGMALWGRNVPLDEIVT
jgi:hypothetical protein